MNLNNPQSMGIPRQNPAFPMAQLRGNRNTGMYNYNQPTEVIGGYDANINPMTGQEIPEVNFAGGGLASLVASPYRDSDVMQVKMTPREVAGLQQLAMSYGAMPEDLYDPVTGQPQFSFLKKLLPTLIGAVLPSVPGLGTLAKTVGFGNTALGTSLLVGGTTALIEGDLKKGLQAGLGAYSGANISESLRAASAAANAAASQAPAIGAEELEKLKKLPEIESAARETVGATTSAPQLVAAKIRELSDPLAGKTLPGLSVNPLAEIATNKLPVLQQPSVFGGVKSLFTSPESRTAFGQALGGGFQSPFMQQMAKTATFSGLANALTPEPKQLPTGGGAMGEDYIYIPGGFNPLYGTGRDQPYQLPGKYYKKTQQGLVPFNPFALAPGGRAAGGEIQSYADGGVVDPNRDPGGAVLLPGPQTPFSPYFTNPVSDPNVAATRAYIEDLNRRAKNPPTYAYPGMGGTGLGGTNRPYVPEPSTGGGEGGGGGGSLTGSPAGDLLVGVGGQYLAQKGIEKGIGAVRDYLDTRPDAAAQKRLIEGTEIADPLAGKDINALPGAVAGVASLIPSGGTPTVGIEELPNDPYAPEARPDYNPSSSGLASIASRNLIDPLAGVDVASLPVNPVADLSSLYNVPNINIPGAAASPSGLASIASRSLIDPLAGVDVASLPVNPVADLTTVPNINTGGTSTGIFGLEKGAPLTGNAAIIPGLQTVLGLHQAYEGIRKGNEVQSALGGFGAATGIASLAGYSGLAALGPIGLAAAAVAALGSSMVNTKEFGDKALENYWKAVDQGRGFGQAPPEELAQGFVNFYRTNKNEFPGQAKYGRTGNEDFVYDMTQVINDAVKSGKVDKGADATTIFEKAVQPWLDSMGSGPQNADARRVQDFMMTDLIHNFMQGKPISNAQVKGDKKFKIVSERPVFAGTPPADMQMYNQMPPGFQGRPGNIPEGAGREGLRTPFSEIEMQEAAPPTPFSEPREVAPDPTPYSPRIIEEEPAAPMPPQQLKMVDSAPVISPALPPPTPFSEPEPRDYIPTPFSEPEPTYYRQPEPEPVYYRQPEPEPVYYRQPEPEPVYYRQPEPEPVYYRQPEPEPTYYRQPEPEPEPVYYRQPEPEPEPFYYPRGREVLSPFAEFGEGEELQFNYGGAVGEDYNFGFARGGMPNEYQAGGKLLDGPGDGMSDDIPAVIRGKGVQRAALADGEFVIPADVVSHLGNGSTKAGAKKLYDMMARVRQARTGKTEQAPAVKTARLLPA